MVLMSNKKIIIKYPLLPKKIIIKYPLLPRALANIVTRKTNLQKYLYRQLAKVVNEIL